MRVPSAKLIVAATAAIVTVTAFGQEGEHPPGRVQSGALSIRVIDGAGQPVAGASVWRLRSHDTDIPGDTKYGSIVQSKTTTGDDGVAETPGGAFACVLAFKGGHAAMQCLPVPSGGVRLTPARAICAVLEPRSGEGPGHAHVRLFFPGGNCRHGVDAIEETDGAYVFPPLPADRAQSGRMQFALKAPGWWSGPYEVPDARADGTTRIGVLRSRNVRGKAIGEDGRGQSGAAVWIVNPSARHGTEGVTTNESGEFLLGDVPESAGRAYMRARGYAPVRIDVPGGEKDADVGNLALKRGVPLSARVVEEDGIDVVRYAVFVEDEDGARIEEAEQDGKGMFHTGALDARPTRVRVFVHASVGVAGSRTVTAELDPGKPDQVVTVPMCLRIRLTDASGKSKRVSSARVTYSGAGVRETSEKFGGSFSEIRTAVKPGLDLEIAVTADDASAGTGVVSVDASGRGDVEVRLTGNR